MRFNDRNAWVVLGALALGLVASGGAASGDDFTPEPGFISLFNGKDLSGWKLDKEILDGKVETADRRFKVHGDAIVTEGARPIENLYTVREFSENFVLRLEFRASPKANSGLFIRGTQLQVRDYPTVGPYKGLVHFNKGGWNAIEVTVKPNPAGKGGLAECTCNGELLEQALAVPASGGIGLQSETNTLEYRRIRIKLQP